MQRPLTIGFAIPAFLLLLVSGSCPNNEALNWNLKLDLAEEFRKAYPAVEMQFLQEFQERLHQSEKDWATKPIPVLRSVMTTFTYPVEQFPQGYPDGVWRADTSNYVAKDKRLLREPIGSEKRNGETGDTLRSVEVWVRQRSDTARIIVGETSAICEFIRERDGRAEIQLLRIRATGKYDESKKRWSVDVAVE